MADVPEVPEGVVVAEAQVLAAQVVEWFKGRLRVAEVERDAADQQRITAEDSQRTSERQRTDAQRRVIEVEDLLAASDELSLQLQQALESRIVIEQAKGFLAARHGVAPDTAFIAIRQYARRNRLSLRTVAEQVVAGSADLQIPDETP